MSPIHAKFSLRRSQGMTLIELMIAMFLGLLVSAGIISVFVSTSKSTRAQEQQARLQETGRFAIQQLTDSLRMVGASYCSGSGGTGEQKTGGSVLVDTLRAPTILATGLSFPDNTTPFGATGYPAEPTVKYSLPSFFYMRGYDCNATTCNPMDPSALPGIPAMGPSDGNRVVGADVLTIRHINPDLGWQVGSDETMALTGVRLDSITLSPETGEPDPTAIASGNHLVMLGDCSNQQVFSTNFNGSDTFTVDPVGGGNMEMPTATNTPAQRSAPKLFLFDRAFTTVTWYLQVVDDGSAAGTTTGALIRRVNGVDQELARGVERLDFRFAVENAIGNTLFLTANQVDAGVSGVNCPEQPPGMPGLPVGGGPAPSDTVQGCLWRGIKAIEVSMLLDGQQRLPSLADQVLAYSYSPDGSSAPQPPDDTSHAILYSAQGFDRAMIRREFSTLVSVRNHNP